MSTTIEQNGHLLPADDNAHEQRQLQEVSQVPSPPLGDKPQHWPVGNYHYHQDRTCDSNTSLKLFDEKPWRYYRERILGESFHKSRSSATEMGTATHILTLQPELFESEVIVLDCGPKSKAFEQVVSTNPGKTVICQDELELVKNMREAILANPEARGIIEHARAFEHAVSWIDSRGVGLKAMFDILEITGDIGDLKTSKDPSYKGFQRAIWDYRYDRQAALYMTARALYLPDAEAELVERGSMGFRWIVVGNEPPHECYVYELGQRTYEIGVRSINESIQRLSDALAFRDEPAMWHGSGYEEVKVIDLPAWVLRDQEPPAVSLMESNYGD